MRFVQQVRGIAFATVGRQGGQPRHVAGVLYCTVEGDAVGQQLHGRYHLAVVAYGKVRVVGVFFREIDIHEIFRVVEARAPQLARLFLYFVGRE